MKYSEALYTFSMIWILQLLSGNSVAQKIALLDTKMKVPVVYTDSVTVGQVSKGFLALPIAILIH
jgi:hypothetical protein